MPGTTQTGSQRAAAGPAAGPAVDQARLCSTLNRYLAARALSRDDPERAAARAALVLLLQEAGWEPPEAVTRALLQDRGAG